MQDSFNKVVAGASMLIIGLYIVSTMFGTMPASEFHDVDNETVVVDHGNTTQLEQAYGDSYYENETALDSSGAVLVEGTDYEFYPGNASIYWYSAGSTTDGENADVSYAFDAKPEAARTSVGTVGNAFTLGAVAVIVVVAALILGIISRGFGNQQRGGGRL
jgi:hypothetical protein